MLGATAILDATLIPAMVIALKQMNVTRHPETAQAFA